MDAEGNKREVCPSIFTNAALFTQCLQEMDYTMETRKPDRRVLKTKRAIRRAFVEMLCSKEMDSITVTDIAEAADINRKTFYNYYSGVPQVMEEIEDEVVTAFEEDLTDFNFHRDVQDVRQIFNRFWTLVEGDVEFYGRLFHQGNNSHLIEKLTTLLRDKSVEYYTAQGSVDPQIVGIVVDYCISGILAVQRSWYLSGREMSLERLSQIVSELTANCVRTFLPQEP